MCGFLLRIRFVYGQTDLGVGSRGSNIVTIKELHHAVPSKARKEMEKAEGDRVNKRMDEAIRHFNRAISIDPELIAARNNLVIVYFESGNPESALAQLEKAITIDPGNSVLFGNLGIGYAMIQKLDAAERAARLAVGLRRAQGHANIVLETVLVMQHKFTEEPLQCLERAWGEYPLAHLLAGRVLIGQRKAERAKYEIMTYLSGKELEYRPLANEWLGSINSNESTNAALVEAISTASCTPRLDTASEAVRPSRQWREFSN